MKKWLAAFALCLALCLCACVALAEDHLAITVSNAEIQNGEVNGAYYYKLYADTNLHSFLMGWSVDTAAEEPDGDEWYPTSLDFWYQDENGYFIVTTPPSSGDYSADVLFYRISENDPWQKLVFNYDLSLTVTSEITGMPAQGPQLPAGDFTLTWDPVEGADAYLVYWKMPGMEDGQSYRYMTPVNSCTINAPSYGEEERNLWPVGEHECWVVAMADQYLVSPANTVKYTVSPLLSLSPWNADFVVPSEDGPGASIKLNQWLSLIVTAPEASFVRIHELQTPEEAIDDVNVYDSLSMDESGEVECMWLGLGQDQDYSRILVAEAYCADGMALMSNSFSVQVDYEGEIEEDIVFSVSHTDNAYDEETGRFQVARDGMLYVDVENMDADFFGLYINQWEDTAWLADSHWVSLSDGQTTRVPLTVPRCQPGQDYDVRVCAIRFGHPQKDAEITIPIHVTEAAADCDVIVTMESEYTIGKPLRVFAHYTNPDEIDGFMQIRIREKGGEDNVVYENIGEFYDYWDNEPVLWQTGDFVVDARIWENDENGPIIREDHQEIWEFSVTAYGHAAAPQVQKFSTFPVGQDLTLTLYAEASEGTVMPEWFDAALFRVDWGMAWIAPAGSGELQDGAGTLTYDKDCFKEGGLYLIRLFGMKPGCEVGVTEFRFLVTSGTASQENLTVTVNGSSQAEQEVLSSSSLYVKVAYEGDRPTAIRMLNGDHWEYWWGDDSFDRDWGFGDDEIMMYAEGTDDDIDYEALQENDWKNFDWEKDVNWTRRSNPIRLNVVSPYGEMAVPSFAIENPEMNEGGSGVIPWGDGIAVRISDPAPMVLDPEGGETQIADGGWFFCNLYVQRWDEPEDYSWWDRVNYDYDYGVHSGLNVIPTYNLEGGCHYQLEIGADGEGYSGRSRWLEFDLGEKPDELPEAIKIFTVNGESEYLELQTYEEMNLMAYCSYAEWYDVEIYKEDDDWWYENRSDNRSGMLIDSWRANEAGVYTLQAYAYGYLRDEEGIIIQDENGEDQWRELIGTVNVAATAVHGNLAPVSASIADKAYYLGDQITFAISAPDNAENFNYWVHPVDDGNWVAGDGRNGMGESTFSTVRLESGVYCVEIDAQAIGYNQSHKTLYFALLDENDEDYSNENRIFTISATEVATETDVRIIAYLRGADAVKAYFSKDGGELEEFRFENAPGLNDWFSRGDAGSYAIYLSGEYGSAWSKPEQVCVLEITSEHEFASEPAITVNGSAQGYAIAADDSNPSQLAVSIGRDQNAEGYHVQVRRYDDGWWFFDQYVDLNDPADDTPFVIGEDAVSVILEDEIIRPGELFVVECYAHAKNYECAGSSRMFLLQPEIQQALTLTVNGSSQTEQEALSSTNVYVKVTSGDVQPTVIRILNGDHWEYWWNTDTYDWDWGFGDGDKLIYAEGTYDDIDFDALDANDWADFDWNRDVNWSIRSNLIHLNVFSPHGEMHAPDFTIQNPEAAQGGAIPWGDGLAILMLDAGPTVLDPDGGEGQVLANGWFFCNLFVLRDEGDGYTWWDRVNYDYNYSIHGGLNTIPTYNLEGGCHYQLEIGADGEGYSGRSRWVEFDLGYKPDELPETIKDFSVNGSTDDQQVQTYKELSLLAYHSNAEWYNVEIHKEGEEDWQDGRSDNRSGMLIDSWRVNEEGTYVLEAYAYGFLRDENGQIVEDENGHNEWEELIGSVTVTAQAPYGNLGPVSASMTDKAYVGDALTITFSAPENAEFFNYWVHPVWDGYWVAGSGRNGTGTATLSTGRLASGVYCVEIDAQATGYNQSHQTLYFALLDENDVEYSGKNRYFTISATEVTTETDVNIIAFLRGAEAIQAYSRKDGGDFEEFVYQDGPGLSTWFSRGDSGSYAIYLSGQFNGVWSEPEQVCTLVITAEHEFASEPAVTVNGTTQGSTVPVDENNPNQLNISISRDENAEAYHLQVRDYGDGWAFFSWYVNVNAQENDTPFTISEDALTISIESSHIQPGRMYEIDCYAHAPGYECLSSHRTFVLQPAGEQNVTLEISPIDDEGFWTGREVHVTASAPNATALYIRMNNEERWYRGDTMDEHWTIWDTGNMFYAYATTDPIPDDDGFFWNELDVQWSMQSELVWVEADTLGDTEIPSLSFNDHVAKGEWLEITIGDDADVRQIDVRIADDNGEHCEFRRYWSPGTYQIATANLNANQRYWVWLTCVQDQHLWTNGTRMALYVDEPAGDGAFFQTDKTMLHPGETFIPMVYAPGAVHIWIENTADGSLWGDWDGENATNNADWEWWYDEPGEWSLTAWALYPGENERTRIGDVVFTVVEPTRLDAPVINAPLEADVTQDIQICVTPVDGGYDYSLELHYFGQNDADWLRWRKTANDVDQESGQLIFTIPAGMLEANKPYWIDVYVQPGRNDYAHYSSDASFSIMTVAGDARDDTITVAVNPGSNVTVTDEGIFIPINSGFDITVSASGSTLPTAIAVCMGDHTNYLFFNDADGSADTEYVGMSEYQPWPETLFVRASYDELSAYERWEDVPWTELNWGSASNTVLVNFTADGQADPPEINCHLATVAGRDMVVTVTLGANANEAHANIDRILGGWEQDLVFDNWIGWEPTEGTDNRGTITIPTDGLAVGAYRLYVDNSGEGYNNSRTTQWFQIAEDPYQSGSKLVLPSGLKTIEEGAFEGIAAETVIIPEGVTTIGSGAFRNSQVRLVVIPDSVTTIGQDAFAGTNLYMVYGFNEGPALQLVHDTNAVAFCYIGD